MKNKKILLFLCLIATNLYAHSLKPSASSFINIPFVTVDCPNNKADSKTGCGAVLYNFSISEYAITAEEYSVFLNAVARQRDPHTLYHSEMTYDVTVASMVRSGREGNYHYAPIKGREALPITYITIYDAARFCNWLENGQPTGDEKATETGSYTLTGDQNAPLVRNEGAKYCIPNENEWYKAAYYDGAKREYYAFPNRSNWSPHSALLCQEPSHNEANYGGATIKSSGEGDEEGNFLQITNVGFYKTSMSPYGAFDMGGNVAEWTESPDVEQEGSEHSHFYDVRGGSWKSPYNYYGKVNELESSTHNSVSAYQASNTLGFRIVKVTGKATAIVSLSDAPDDYWLTPVEAAGAAVVGGAVLSAGVAKVAMAPTEAAKMVDAASQRIVLREHAPLKPEVIIEERRASIQPFSNLALSPVNSPIRSKFSSKNKEDMSAGEWTACEAGQKQSAFDDRLKDLRESEEQMAQTSQEIWQHRREGWTHGGRIGANLAAAPLTWRLIYLAVVAFGHTYGTDLVTYLLSTPPHRWHSMVDGMGYAAAGTAAATTLRSTQDMAGSLARPPSPRKRHAPRRLGNAWPRVRGRVNKNRPCTDGCVQANVRAPYTCSVSQQCRAAGRAARIHNRLAGQL